MAEAARVTQTRINAEGYKVRTYVEEIDGEKRTWKTVEVPIEVLRRSATKSRLDNARRAAEREARRLKVERLLSFGMPVSQVAKEAGMSTSNVYLIRDALRARVKKLNELAAQREVARSETTTTRVASVFDLGRS